MKYNVRTGTLIADASRKTSSWEEALLVDSKVTAEQARTLNEVIKNRPKYRDRKPYLFEVEIEFQKLFTVCDTCACAIDRAKHNKAWGKNCRDCHQIVVKKRTADRIKRRDYYRQVRRYRLHYNTPQGKVDAIPIQLIKENTRLEMKLKGETFSSVARALDIDEKAFRAFFENRTISRHLLAQIAGYLKIPISRLTHKRRGVTLRLKDGVPEFWLHRNFRIRYYDD